MSNRRKYFKVLDPVIQRHIYIWLSLVWFGWVLIQSSFFFLFEYIGDSINQDDKKFALIVLFFVTSSILFIFTLLSMNFFINKFLGPIYRIRKDLKEADENNEPPSIKLREEDYFQDVAEYLNRMHFKD